MRRNVTIIATIRMSVSVEEAQVWALAIGERLTGVIEGDVRVPTKSPTIKNNAHQAWRAINENQRS